MTTIKKIGIKVFALIVCLISVSLAAQAQDYKKYYANGNWQFNIPISNDFTERGSGWGMNFEGGYFVTPKIGLGLFIAYSSNHKYIDTQTIPVSSNSMITTNQQRTTFQLPFGATFRYKMMNDNWVDPYVAFKVGAEYCQLSSYISTLQIYERNWGFYMSPEIGTNIWLTEGHNIGLNLSIYYSFATNKGSVLDGSIDNLNNFGFRIGLAF